VTALSIGIAGTVDAEIVRRLAPRIEAAGYRTLWINDTPGGDSLAGLAAAAEVTSTLRLATGVIPLDRRGAAEVARRVRELALPERRTTLGIGSGGARRVLDLLESGVAELRAATPARIVVGALGPRSRALAARVADGILFNWLSTDAARGAMAQLRADAPAGRTPEGILYARTIADEAARPALEVEAARYRSFPSYAANFARLGLDPLDTAIDLTGGRAVPDYGDLDELVLRAITATGSESALARLVDVAAPAAR
jgi:alkanesulfonate monooxygenase SsuD/methylene tetrahydromethanopterin reductase-like flavin-dependent oxidoreductase (luciferase family)